jgi:hypothetical protein
VMMQLLKRQISACIFQVVACLTTKVCNHDYIRRVLKITKTHTFQEVLVSNLLLIDSFYFHLKTQIIVVITQFF